MQIIRKFKVVFYFSVLVLSFFDVDVMKVGLDEVFDGYWIEKLYQLSMCEIFN